MGVVPHGEQPVSHGEAQVVLVELDEGRVELGGFAHAACKSISLELKPATQDRQTEGQELQPQHIQTTEFVTKSEVKYKKIDQKWMETLFIEAHPPHCTGRR